MAMICLNCGNTGHFIRVAHGYEHFTEDQIFHGENEEVIEYGNYESHDSEITEYEPFKCDKCNSQEVMEDLTEKKLIKIKILHTKKDGEWSVDELPENEQDQDILNNHVANKV